MLITTIVQLSYAYTIWKPENSIQEVTFTDESLQMYDNKDLYEFIRTELKWKNIIMLRLKKWGDVKRHIKDTYPFVKDLTIEKTWPSTVLANISFYQADLVFKNDNTQVAYSNKFLLETNDNNAITSGAIFIKLPSYFSGDHMAENATGYIALIWTEKIKNDMLTITQYLQVNEILFLIGAQKSIIDTENVRLTFDHKRNIEAQLEYYSTMQSLDPAFFYEIDLTTYPTVIIRKWEWGMPAL